jgi:hypothetical protein
LLSNSTVTELWLSVDDLYAEDIPNFVAEQCLFLKYLATSQHLEEVTLTLFGASERYERTYTHILSAIRQNTKIRSLTCFEGAPLAPLGDLLARTVSTTKLSMRVPNVGPAMTETLQDAIEAMSSNTTLKWLTLRVRGENSLVFLDPFLVRLAGHSQLDTLYLAGGTVVPFGLCRLLQSTTKISCLCLLMKSYDAESSNAFVHAVCGNSTLRDVLWTHSQSERTTREQNQRALVKSYACRNARMRVWFASESSNQRDLDTKNYWPSIFPSLLAATLPMRSVAPPALISPHQHHVRPPPNAMLMALLHMNDIGPSR